MKIPLQCSDIIWCLVWWTLDNLSFIRGVNWSKILNPKQCNLSKFNSLLPKLSAYAFHSFFDEKIYNWTNFHSNFDSLWQALVDHTTLCFIFPHIFCVLFCLGNFVFLLNYKSELEHGFKTQTLSNSSRAQVTLAIIGRKL